MSRWQVLLSGSVWEEHNHPNTTNLHVRMSAVKTLYCLQTDVITDSHCADRCHSHQRLQSHKIEIWDSWTIFTFYFGRINIKTNVWRLPREVCRNVRHQHLFSWLVCCRMHDGDVTYVCINMMMVKQSNRCFSDQSTRLSSSSALQPGWAWIWPGNRH